MQRGPNCSLNATLRLTAVCVVIAGLSASEHHGTVSGARSPIPGATVTAAQGDKKFVTATDDQGRYSFPDLPEGIWTLQVEALGFAKLSREVGIAFDAPSPSWELRLLTLDQVRREVAASEAGQATVKATPPAPARSAAETATANQPKRPTGEQGHGARENNRPSLRQSPGQDGFQRMDVNPTGESAVAVVVNGGDTPPLNGMDRTRAPMPILSTGVSIEV